MMSTKNNTFFCPLASGSRGNSIFVKYMDTTILIDAGLSFLSLKERLKKIDECIENIDAIFITHEHKDHIEALKQISQKTKIPVICNLETAKGIYSYIKTSCNFKIFVTDKELLFKDMKILPFTILHDSLEPVGFLIKTNKTIGVCSDIGFVTSFVKNILKDCDLLYIEANHDENMLAASRRPERLKKRILGRQGHLSNNECAFFLESILSDKLKNIYLSHISSECNSKELAYKVIKDVIDKKKLDVNLYIANQDEVSFSVASM